MDPFMEGPDGGRCFMEMFQQRAQYTPILCPPPPPPPFHHVHHYPPFQNEAFPVPQPNSFFYNGTTYFYQPDQLQAPRGAEVEGVNGVQPGPEDLPIQAFQKLSMSNLYEEDRIRNVWSFNLYNEFRTIRSLLKQYHYVAMDTEFPGIVAFPIAKFDSNYEYQYQRLRANVDMLNIIQVGLTFFDEHGNSPPGISTWQFNFQFSLAEEMYSQESIQVLKNAGINFQRHETEGIEWRQFSEFFMSSGFVLNDNVKWISFHGGYDFAYLMKILSDRKLPDVETEFFDMLKLYFPFIYDVKYIMQSCKYLSGGLQEVANQLDIPRLGIQHQAGSDSLLTGISFFRMKEMYFDNHIEDYKYNGRLYGFESTYEGQDDATD